MHYKPNATYCISTPDRRKLVHNRKPTSSQARTQPEANISQAHIQPEANITTSLYTAEANVTTRSPEVVHTPPQPTEDNPRPLLRQGNAGLKLPGEHVHLKEQPTLLQQ